jgi:hypothetical protein
VIVVKGVGADGMLDAMYYNPQPLPFASAKASREMGVVHARSDLVAVGQQRILWPALRRGQRPTGRQPIPSRGETELRAPVQVQAAREGRDRAG